MATKVRKLSKGYGYVYADMATIHDELEKQGITYQQKVEFNASANADYIWTKITGDGYTDEWLCGCRIIVGDGRGMQSAMQGMGSAISYARRYSLLAALGWATEDDDGATAGEGSPEQSYSRGGIDLAKFKAEVESQTTADGVRKVYAPFMVGSYTDKQRAMLQEICKKRISQLDDIETAKDVERMNKYTKEEA